jgi:hypothetical protein
MGGRNRYQLQFPLANRVALPPKELLTQTEGGAPALASTIQARPNIRYAGRSLDLVVGDTLNAVAEEIKVTYAGKGKTETTQWRRGEDERVLALTVKLSNRTDRSVRLGRGAVNGCFISDKRGRRHNAVGMITGGKKALEPGESGTFLVMFNVPKRDDLAVLSVSEGGGGQSREYRFQIGRDVRVSTNAVAQADRLLKQMSARVAPVALGLFNPRAKIGSTQIIFGGALTPGSVGLFTPDRERPKVTPRYRKPADREPAPKDDASPPGKTSGAEGAHVPGLGKLDGRHKTPWHDARVGDTMTYKGLGKTRTVWKVTAVGDDTVTVHQAIIFKGRTQPGGTRTYKRFTTVAPDEKRTPSNMKVKHLPDQTLEVAGMKLNCKVREVTVSYNGKDVRNRTWTCDKVPGGIVKATSNASGEMRVTMELVNLKRATDAR